MDPARWLGDLMNGGVIKMKLPKLTGPTYMLVGRLTEWWVD